MANKPQTSAPQAIIKWTPEEWERIAARLLEAKGQELMQSPDLEAVKARDIFEAQEMLPEPRHRKLISLYQGIDASRQRLLGILQKRQAAGSATGMQSAQQQDDAAPAPLDDAPTLVSSDADTADHEAPQPAAESAADTAAGADAHVSTAQPAPQEAVSADNPTNEDATPRHGRMPAADPVPSVPRRPGEASRPNPTAPRSAPSVDAAASASDMPAPAKVDLVELARPFVAMVCQEFASALVKAISQGGGAGALASIMQGVGAPSARFNQNDRAAQRNPDRANPPRPRPGAAQEERAEQPPQVDDPMLQGDDEHLHENDIQPLFDPKLPPSPNSADKPKIALIGTSARDLEDFKVQFPQFLLSVVPLDAIPRAPALHDCQRIIGLREDIPLPADETLRRTFGHRYVRVSGGIGSIRSQLSSWLDNPTAMTAGPSWPNKKFANKGRGKSPNGSNNNNNNNNNNNGNQKRRQNRPPKPPRP